MRLERSLVGHLAAAQARVFGLLVPLALLGAVAASYAAEGGLLHRTVGDLLMSPSGESLALVGALVATARTAAAVQAYRAAWQDDGSSQCAVDILCMVPLYAWCSYLHLELLEVPAFANHHLLFDAPKEVYKAAALMNFLGLM